MNIMTSRLRTRVSVQAPFGGVTVLLVIRERRLVTRRSVCGARDGDYIQQALLKYQAEYGVLFTLMHACAELKDCSKWKEAGYDEEEDVYENTICDLNKKQEVTEEKIEVQTEIRVLSKELGKCGKCGDWGARDGRMH
ncbi:hypothetical protein Tco_0198991 [Tanacetum coccineum]